MSALCTQCNEREAVVRLTQVQGDQVVTLRLCERCAAERGVDTGIGLGATPLGGFLAALGAVVPAPEGESAEEPRSCPNCAATLDDFRASGRVGCARCWDTFASSLTPLVRRLHGSTHHTGGMYEASGPVGSPEAEARRLLTERLQLAIDTENFELAAELRDRLKGHGND
jgi:protein arginine kinase activator